MPLHKTLVIQPLPGIGDMLWYLPYLRTIARQSSDQKISILTKHSVQVEKLLGHEPFIDQCLSLNRPRGGSLKAWKLAQELKPSHFQSVWVLHHSPGYALASWLAGIPHRHGYGLGWQKLFLNHPPYLSASYKSSGPQKRAASYLTSQGLTPKSDDQTLTPSPQALCRIQTTYGHLPKPWSVLGFGASESFKRWPLDRFVLLAQWLEKTIGGTVFLIGSPQESDLGSHAITLAQQQNIPLTVVTGTPLDQSVALISQADLFVGNCSGPLNIAACLGVPSFGLFGITEPLTYTDSLFSITPSTNNSALGMESLSLDDVTTSISQWMAKYFCQ